MKPHALVPAVALLLALLPAVPARTAAGPSGHSCDPRLREIREFVREEVASGSSPSLSLAVAAQGRVLWEEAFGWADRENGIPATPRTGYRLASIAKPIAATAVMRLAEAGAVELDAPVERSLGGLALEYRAGSPAEVTVRRLLQHRAGLAPYNRILFLDEEPVRPPFRETVRRYGIVMFQPGWSFIYSNLGYQLLARVVERASGVDYPRYVRENVFAPLGMADAQILGGGEPAAPAAVAYDRRGRPVSSNVATYYGSTDACCSAHDLLRFAMFHLGTRLPDQVAILADSTREAMQREDPPGNTRYGLGWYFDVDELGIRSLYHGGQITGVAHFMRMIPAVGIAIVILSNTDYPSEKLLKIQGDIAAALIPELAAAARERDAEGSPETVGAAEDRAAAPRFPEELRGTWRGRIVAHDREIETTLTIGDGGARILLAGQDRCDVDFTVVTSGFLLGTFPGTIPIEDIARYDVKVRLALVRSEGRLSGQATAVGWREDRQTDCELSSWIELARE